MVIVFVSVVVLASARATSSLAYIYRERATSSLASARHLEQEERNERGHRA
jgi:hypothetical protein